MINKNQNGKFYGFNNFFFNFLKFFFPNLYPSYVLGFLLHNRIYKKIEDTKKHFNGNYY